MNKISEFKLNLNISKIQKIFRINKIKKHLAEFRELQISQCAEGGDFDNFSKFLRTKNVIVKTRVISEYYSKIGYKNKLNGQKILTSYILKNFSDIILGAEKNRHPQDKVVISWGENLVDLFNNLAVDNYSTFINFGKFLVNYEKIINEWLKNDKNRTIESIVISYKNMRDTIEEINKTENSKMAREQKKNVIYEINNQIKQLLNSLRILDKDFDIKYLKENYQQVYDNLEKGYEKILSGLAISVKKAFLNKITEDLKKGELKSLVFNFIEIGERLIEICPKKFKKTFSKKFSQEHITDIFYDQDWNEQNKVFLLLILDTIILFDSKENEKNNFEFKNTISILTLNKFIDNIPKIILMINEKIDDLVRLIMKLTNE